MFFSATFMKSPSSPIFRTDSEQQLSSSPMTPKLTLAAERILTMALAIFWLLASYAEVQHTKRRYSVSSLKMGTSRPFIHAVLFSLGSDHGFPLLWTLPVTVLKTPGIAPVSAIIALIALTTSMMVTPRGHFKTHLLHVVQPYRISSDSYPSTPNCAIRIKRRILNGPSTIRQGHDPAHMPHCIQRFSFSAPMATRASFTS